MKTVLFILISLSSHAIFAETVESQVQFLLQKISMKVFTMNQLSEEDQVMVLKSLAKADQILNHSPTMEYPIPPRFPVNHPHRPSRPSVYQLTCSQDLSQNYQEIFTTMKQFAYSTQGLNMAHSEAGTFAQNWTEKFPCSYSEKYKTQAVRLRKFAYLGKGLDYTITSAIDFALTNTPIFCENYPLETEFERHFQFAYQTKGLNMSASAAREYALKNIKPEAFSCSEN